MCVTDCSSYVWSITLLPDDLCDESMRTKSVVQFKPKTVNFTVVD